MADPRGREESDGGSGATVDDSWLGPFLEEHKESVWRMALACTHDEDAAEDLVAAAYVRFIQAFRNGSVDPTRNPLGYLRAIVRNLARDRVRRAGTEVVLFGVRPSTPEERLVESSEHHTMARARQALNDRDQRCIELFVDDGLTSAEVGREMGLTDSGARELLGRSKKRAVKNYIQEFTGGSLSRECRGVVAALVDDEPLSKSQHEHLADCRQCSAACHELSSLGIRRFMPILPPIPAALSVRLDDIVRNSGSNASATVSAAGAGNAGSIGGVVLAVACAVGVVVFVGGLIASWPSGTDGRPRVDDRGDMVEQAADFPPVGPRTDAPPNGEDGPSTQPASADGGSGDRGAELPRPPAPDDGAGAGSGDPTVVHRDPEPAPNPDGDPGLDGGDDLATPDSVVVIAGSGQSQIEISLPLEPLPELAEVEVMTEESVVEFGLFGEKVLSEP